MPTEEDISHLEREIARLQEHLVQQDAEILKIARVTDSLNLKLKQLESLITDNGIDSPLDSEAEEFEDPPPHY